MSIIASIVYGLLSGITEFFPISARAHQRIMLHLCGRTTRDPLQDLLVHIAILISLLYFSRSMLNKMRLLRNRINDRRYQRAHFRKNAFDSRLIRTASVPLLIGSLLYIATLKFENSLPTVALFLILNGAILLLVEHIPHGNRDASTMSGMDGIIMGVGGSLAFLPGLSRTGMISAYCVGRGADKQTAINWAITLAIPALAVMIFLDIILLITSGIVATSFATVIGYFFGAMAAFGGTYLGITLVRIVLSRSGFSGFAYYSFGAALLSFILYLITW